jgi:coenzyme F420 biosynthesis associated uncharacterized protein
MVAMIDWKLAGTVAHGVAGLQSAGDPAPFEHPETFAAESERLVSAYTGLSAATMPSAEAVGREGWIDANLGSMSGVLDPVVERIAGRGSGALGGVMSSAAGALLALEAGAITGFLAGRVLGQLEFPVLDPSGPARLLFVAPNLGQAARHLEAEPDVLLRWVALHETTHALQFGGVPWLRPHLAELVGELLKGLEVDPRSLLRLPDPRDLGSLLEKARKDGVAALALGPERRAVLDRLQSLMAVLEGYAEHVMDAVGAGVIEDLPRLRGALQRRRQERSGLLRVLERVIGMDLKLRQYEQGKAFCDGVVERAGMTALNRVWEGPTRLPTPAELEDPGAWLARSAGPLHPQLTPG